MLTLHATFWFSRLHRIINILYKIMKNKKKMKGHVGRGKKCDIFLPSIVSFIDLCLVLISFTYVVFRIMILFLLKWWHLPFLLGVRESSGEEDIEGIPKSSRLISWLVAKNESTSNTLRVSIFLWCRWVFSITQVMVFFVCLHCRVGVSNKTTVKYPSSLRWNGARATESGAAFFRGRTIWPLVKNLIRSRPN